MCQEWLETIPSVSTCMAGLVLIINIFLPGLGTLLLACLGPSFTCTTQTCVGILQILTAPFIIGWIWSIYWGILACSKSYEPQPEVVVVSSNPSQEVVVVQSY